MRKILLTGFEPFGGESINPSWEAVLKVQEPEGIKIFRQQIPVEFETCLPTAEEAIREFQPDCVLCVGMAGGRDAVTPERIAINLDDARIPDNAGQKPCDKPILPDGPAAYFTTLPAKRIVEEIENSGIRARLSYTAGTFVCDHLLYGLLHLAEEKYPHMKVGFIHVPMLPEQVTEKTQPSMPLKEIVEALNAAVRVIGRL